MLALVFCGVKKSLKRGSRLLSPFPNPKALNSSIRGFEDSSHCYGNSGHGDLHRATGLYALDWSRAGYLRIELPSLLENQTPILKPKLLTPRLLVWP